MSSSEVLRLLDEILVLSKPMSEIDRFNYLWAKDNINHNVYNYMVKIDCALSTYYNKMSKKYHNDNGDGKFYLFCKNNNLENDDMIMDEFNKSSSNCKLVKFDETFPFQTRQQIESNTKNKYDKIKNILTCFLQHGEIFMDSLINQQNYSLSLYNAKYRQILFDGFCTDNNNNDKIKLYKDIKQLIWKFYNNEYCINFQGVSFKTFLSSSIGNKYEYQLLISGIMITIQIYPNGSKLKYRGQILIYAQTEIPSNIKCINLHFEWFCPQLNVYKYFHIFLHIFIIITNSEF